MRPLSPLMILFCLLPGLLLACGGEDGIFAYVRNGQGQAARGNVASYKYEVAAGIFNRLMQARGDFRQPAPDFVMNDGRRNMAWMNPKKRQVGLEEAAYDLCVSFGPDSLNALAALLAHEMIHYYEKHDWTRQFAGANPDTEAAKAMKGQRDGLPLETQADYLGGFLALSAGFDTYGIVPELLPKAYEAYGLPAQLPDYPPLTDRIAFAHNASGHLQKLSTAFRAASCLTVVGAYDEALDYYQYILKDYQSRELYNNLGVLDVLSALEYFSPKEMPYALPLELDAESRLNRTSRAVDSVAVRTALLQDALRQFERAAQLDGNYPAALLNSACAHLLLGEGEDATYWARKAKKLAQKLKLAQEAADADILLGIISALEGDGETAGASFRKAAEAGHPLGVANLAALSGEDDSASNILGFATTPETGVERIDGLLLDDFMAAPDLDMQVEVSKGVFCGFKQRPNSQVVAHYVDENNYAFFLISRENFEGATRRGIKAGDALDALLEAYPGRHNVVSARQGTFLVYPLEKLIFLIGSDGRLKQWVAYRMKWGEGG